MCVCGVQLNLSLVGLLNVSIALEDPFDNQGLDGIYIDEALFEAEQVRLAAPCTLAAQAVDAVYAEQIRYKLGK